MVRYIKVGVFNFSAIGFIACVFIILLSVNDAVARKSFTTWLHTFRQDAIRFGIRTDVFDRAMQGVTPDYRLPDLNIKRAPLTSNQQAEFIRPPQVYLNEKALRWLVMRGRKLFAKYRRELAQINQELGVAPEVVLAIWGRETAFGEYQPPHNAIRVLATQAYVGKRRRMLRRELLYALKLLQNGVATQSQLKSSWAGAIGMTQFMPSEYETLAYDLDRDGKKNIWSAGDALASAANQLRDKGWQSGQTWGFEVRLTTMVNCAMDGPRHARTIRQWAALGLIRPRGQAFPQKYLNEVAFLFTPGGSMGPAFLVLENFMVFKRYNPSDLYALFVGHLADRIAGGKRFEGKWRNIRQLHNKDITKIQRYLKADGFSISKIDGKIGTNTRSQIGQYQQTHRLPIDCWPSQSLINFMRQRTKR